MDTKLNLYNIKYSPAELFVNLFFLVMKAHLKTNHFIRDFG